MIKADDSSGSYSVIVIGGVGGIGGLDTVEILDEGATEWRFGENFPIIKYLSSAVEDRYGGVILIGGMNSDQSCLQCSNRIYHLSHASSSWQLMEQTLESERSLHFSFLVTDELCIDQSIP